MLASSVTVEIKGGARGSYRVLRQRIEIPCRGDNIIATRGHAVQGSHLVFTMLCHESLILVCVVTC